MGVRKEKILFLNWKDISHPSAGGAELLTDTLATNLAQTSEVTYFTSRYPGAEQEEEHNGYTIIRRGNLYTTYLWAFIWWHTTRQYAQGYTYIIDQAHGIPFFAYLYYKHPRIVLIIHEVAGMLWRHSFGPYVGGIGQWFERLWLRLYRHVSISTVSQSTKEELISYGISPTHISVIPLFSEATVDISIQKPNVPTLLVLGRIAPVKRIEDAIAAYRIIQQHIPDVRLVIMGKQEEQYSAYYESLRTLIGNDPNIHMTTNVSNEEKNHALESSHLLVMCSRKEGYGIVIVEAAMFKTPAVAYGVPGIQDAIQHGINGLITDENPEALAQAAIGILNNPEIYHRIQKEAYARATLQTPERTVSEFRKILYGT